MRRLEARDDLAEGLEGALAEEIEALMGEPGTLDIAERPSILLFVGVNGTGKTTTIGKLAQRLREHDHDVIVAAADTFRAAADEQLEVWADRAGADFVGAARGGDPAAVAFDAIEAAQSRDRDVVLVDTAGRLHTHTNLMAELAKVRRVIASKLEGAPHETLLVVDATTGQNGVQQARLFQEAVDVSGVVLTKLDGSARGGVAVAIAHELGLPVKLVGVGERLEDLQPFDPQRFRAGACRLGLRPAADLNLVLPDRIVGVELDRDDVVPAGLLARPLRLAPSLVDCLLDRVASAHVELWRRGDLPRHRYLLCAGRS